MQQKSAAISASLSFSIMNLLIKVALLVAWKSHIMGHTPLNMHAGHVRPVYPAPLCQYQWYGTLMQWISAAIYTSLLLSITEPPIQASLPCCTKHVHYGSHPIEYAWRSCETYFSWLYVSIPIIWNMVAMNKCCHIRITAIFHHGAPCSS